MKRFLLAILVLFSCDAIADTPPPGTVKAKVFSGDGATSIGAVSDALKTNISNSSLPVTQSGSWTVGATISNFPATQAVTQSGTWTVGRTWSLSSGSDSVAAVQSGTWNVGLSTGSNTIGKVDQGTGGASAWKVDGSAVTQPVSAASLPLPAGAATSANQTTANSSLSSIDSKLTSPVTVTGPLTDTQLRATPVPVSGTVSANQSGTWNINNVSGTVSLPTGAATSANQTTANSSLSSIDGKLNSLGQKTMANSVPVVISSDQSALPVSEGRTSVQLVRNDYTSTNVTTAAYVQLIASTSDTTNELYIFDSSGQTLFLAVGAAASEVNKAYIVPGGNGILHLNIPSDSRVSVKAVSGTASAGELNITFLK